MGLLCMASWCGTERAINQWWCGDGRGHKIIQPIKEYDGEEKGSFHTSTFLKWQQPYYIQTRLPHVNAQNEWKETANLSLFLGWNKLRTAMPSESLFLVGLKVGSCVDLRPPCPVNAVEVVWVLRPRLWVVVPPPASLLVIMLPAVPVL